MLKQAYRHKNQQPPLVPWLTPGASLIATRAFVLFVAGFIVTALMLVAVSALICIFYFASWYVFNDIVPSNRALWVYVLSSAHIVQCTGFIPGMFLKIKNTLNTDWPDPSIQKTMGSCFELWRAEEVTHCLHNRITGDLKGRCEHRGGQWWERAVLFSPT